MSRIANAERHRQAIVKPTSRVLVVDDEENIVYLVESSLKVAGFETASARCGRDAIRMVEVFRPDLLVLDVMLPDLDGFAVLQRLRVEGNETPIIFLTARDSTDDRVHGLTVGGDDYIVKPFAVAELVARVRLSLGRRGQAASDATLACADLHMDDRAHLVTRAGVPVHLSPKEYQLLRYLLINTGRVLTRAQILDQVWQFDFGSETSVVDTFVSALRRKIDNSEPKLIHTVRGVGYCLREG